jgi:anthranilate synthase component 1
MAISKINAYKTLSLDYKVVPVWTEINADLETPVSIFMKTGGEILLESLEKGNQAGRYSIIGIGKKLSVTLRNRTVETVTFKDGIESGRSESTISDPLDYLRNLMSAFKAPELPELPPFWGGLVGYLGYEIAGFFEDLPMPPSEDDDIPDALLIIPEIVIICDAVKRTAFIVVTTIPGDSPEENYNRAASEIERRVDLIKRPISSSTEPVPAVDTIIESEPDIEEFMSRISRCIEYIRAGDIIQAVLSRRTVLRSSESPLSLYRKLRRVNPSPYMFFLDFGDIVLTGSSPEVMVRVQGDELFLKPIAGTRPRGLTIRDDGVLAEELLSDPKETAEHLMLVDLGRNDLGRVAVPGSIEVTDYMSVERFSHVMHIVSSVRGRLMPGYDGFDVIKATFPAGTLTGAPKIRAMEIISELENARRGHYGGMVLYLGFNGNLDSCITIRSMLCRSGRITVQAGAGIVADSIPEREYQETVNKAEALLGVITGERGMT